MTQLFMDGPLVLAQRNRGLVAGWRITQSLSALRSYEAVHFSGIARHRMLDDDRPHGDALLAVSEARLPKEPWELAAMEPTKRETMLAAIRFIDIVIDEVEGQSKLNQHKLVGGLA
jgi:transcriptional regulator